MCRNEKLDEHVCFIRLNNSDGGDDDDDDDDDDEDGEDDAIIVRANNDLSTPPQPCRIMRKCKRRSGRYWFTSSHVVAGVHRLSAALYF